MKAPTRREIAAWEKFERQVGTITTRPARFAARYYWLHGYRAGRRAARK